MNKIRKFAKEIVSAKMEKGNYYIQHFSNNDMYFYVQTKLKNGNPQGLFIDTDKKHVKELSIRNQNLWQPIEEKNIPQDLLIKIKNNKKSSNLLKGFNSNIEEDTIQNDNFRKVLYTGKNSQLVLMSLNPNEDIGEEVHEDTDQFFRIEKGTGKVIIDNNEYDIKDGSAIVIPQGAKHNVIAGIDGLKIYTIYSPPHHQDKIIHTTKEEAKSSKEKFDGITTEK